MTTAHTTLATASLRTNRPQRSTWLGLLLIAAALPGLWITPSVFLAAWLAAWWWCLGLVTGSLTLLWMHRLTGGRWGDVLRPAVKVVAARLPWLIPLFLPIAFGLPLLYPWAADPAAWAHEMTRPAFAQAWLSPVFFLARMAVYAAVWLWLARSAALAVVTSGRAAASLIAHGLVTSLAAVDLLASLVPGWSSSAFGLLALISQMLAGSALVVGLTAALRRHGVATPLGEPPVWRDLGNLLLMGVSMWGYLAFMQFLIIWAENLPREISWFVPRLQTGWQPVGVAVVLCNLMLPLFALLLRSVKDRPARLARLSFGLLAAQALDAAWMVMPSVDAHSLHGWWLLPLLIVGMALLLFGGVPAAVQASPEQEDRHE
jgi:hypothetical protein